MKTYDDNWAALKQEQMCKMIEEPIANISLDAEQWTLTLWYNNPRQMKLEWREGVVRHTAWVYRDNDPGSWRTREYAIWDYLRTDLRNEQDLALRRLTAKQVTDQGTRVIEDLKLIAIEQHKRLGAMILIINQTRKLISDPSMTKDKMIWRFK
jgi:hypothetical protein